MREVREHFNLCSPRNILGLEPAQKRSFGGFTHEFYVLQASGSAFGLETSYGFTDAGETILYLKEFALSICCLARLAMIRASEGEFSIVAFCLGCEREVKGWSHIPGSMVDQGVSMFSSPFDQTNLPTRDALTTNTSKKFLRLTTEHFKPNPLLSEVKYCEARDTLHRACTGGLTHWGLSEVRPRQWGLAEGRRR